MQQLGPVQVKEWLDAAQAGGAEAPLLLDVREPWEFDICRIDGAQLMPMRSVPARLEELPRDRPIVVVCHHGGRSAQVGYFLEQQGFSQITNLQGGVAAWAGLVDPAMPTY